MPRWSIVLVAAAVVACVAWLVFGTGDVPEPPAEPAVIDLGPMRPARVASPVHLELAAAISGHVRDEHGRGIADATVCATGWSPRLDRRDREAPGCVLSDAGGGYRIDHLWPVPYGVDASAPRFVPASYRDGPRQRVALRAGQEATDIDIVLRGGGVLLSGVVLDLSGGEVSGALVRVGAAHGSSAADGSFSLWVAPGQVFALARADGYAEGSQTGVAPGQRFALRLTPESVLVGRVVRAGDHAPIADASVYAQESGGWHGIGPAISDADGRFRVAGLQPGSYKLEARHDEAYGLASESVVLGLGETSDVVEIEAHPAYLVEGTVALDSGEPCPAGQVQLAAKGGTSVPGAIEPDGAVRLPGVLPGTYTLQIECQGAAKLSSYPEVVVVDRPVSGLRWPVLRGQSISGEVVRVTGERARGLWVRAEPIATSTIGTVHAPGDDGDFELAGLLPGRYRLHVGSHDYPAPAPVEVEVLVGQDLTGVRIVLPATGELRGTVRDSEGAPVKDVEVELREPGALSTRTADDGSFHLRHVAVGSVRVFARAGAFPLRSPGTTYEDPQGVAVTIAADAVTTVQLVVESRRGQIRGRVVDSAGGPVEDAFVAPAQEQPGIEIPGRALQSASWGRFFGETTGRTLTDHDGAFVIDGLGEGKYSLLARRRSGGEAALEHVLPGAEVVLRIADPAQLAGRVRISGRDAPQQFSVAVYAEALGFRANDRFFRTGGVFRFPEVPAGDYTLTVESPEGTATATAKLTEGSRTDLQIEVTPWVTVRGQFVDLDSGAGVPGMQVRMSLEGQRQVFSSLDRPTGAEISDVQGFFTLAKVAAGANQMTILPIDPGSSAYAPTGLRVEVPGADPAFELSPVKLVRRRVGDDGTVGDLGFTIGAGLVVATVRAGGPAALAGLKVGDTIVSVDGHVVTGDVRLFASLAYASAGTRLQLGLASGVTIELTIAPPR